MSLPREAFPYSSASPTWAEPLATPGEQRLVANEQTVSIRSRGDIYGVLSLLILNLIVAWEGIRSLRMIFGADILTFFLPRFTYLGEQLRELNLPGWIPYTLSGAPFLGDPESGWLYLPAMVAFTVSPGTTGYYLFIIFHLATAGFTTYALARVLGMNVAGAVAAATAYEFSGMGELSRCCLVFAEIQTWIPVGFLGIEMATRARTWFSRVGWLAVAGLAVSQMIAGWLGQGSYYGLLAIGAFAAYRTLIWPPSRNTSLIKRGIDAVVLGAAVLGIGFGLAAGAVLPRLEVVSRAVLNGDYSSVGGPSPGWEIQTIIDRLLTTDDNIARWYMGGAVFALAVLAPFVARWRYSTPFFFVYSVAAIWLAVRETRFHVVLHLLPGFMGLHQHLPERALLILFFGPAMLAGATVSALTSPEFKHSASASRWIVAVLALVPVGTLLWFQDFFDSRGQPLERFTLVTAGAVGLFVACAALIPKTTLLRVAAVALLLTVFTDPTGHRLFSELPSLEATPQTSALVAKFYEPNSAGQYLQQAQATSGQPFRFFGYEPSNLYYRGRTNNYLISRYSPLTMTLLVNNRSVLLGLQDIQGYNPIQSKRYVDLINAINGEKQGYHQSNILYRGSSSPLLNLLNVRYIVVPVDIPPGRPDLFHLSQRHRTVYVDDTVRILENESALPRAWIVHRAWRVGDEHGFEMLASGEANPREVALLDRDVDRPVLVESENQGAESVKVVSFEPDQMTLESTMTAAGLVVLSEVYDPGWTAYIDGKRVPVYATFHALRSVPVPAGTHTIELRYETPGMKLGLLTSAATAAIVAIALAYLYWRTRTGRPLLVSR